MATYIKSIANKSKYHVAYLGKVESGTGWSALGFGPGQKYDLGNGVETTEGNQALLTRNGDYVIWDDGNWNIKVKHNDDPPYVLVHVDARFLKSPQIDITVEENGQLFARQLAAEAAAQAG